MIITRKLGKLIRGNTTPFQIYAAGLLGAFIGFTPGFDHAPGLILFWSFLLLILNANLFFAGLIGLLSKGLYLLLLPVAFRVGEFLLEGPTQGLFQGLHNAPIAAYFGLDYYAVVGGQFFALLIGIVSGFLVTRSLDRYRKRKSKKVSDGAAPTDQKKWIKALEWIFVGKKTDKAYEDLLERRIGNPIRIPGVIVIAVLSIGLFIASKFLTDTLIASLARTGLATANGATVDLESAHLDLDEGKLELINVAFADPNDLGTDILRTKRILADISGADLLKKRFSIDKLVVDSATSGEAREKPGKLEGPRSRTSDKPIIQVPDFTDLESVVENGKIWKERLSQLKRWLDRISSVSNPGIVKSRKEWKEELASRIRSMGHANVKANELTQDSPLIMIRELEALGLITKQLEGRQLDIQASNLSSHPHLLDESPAISLKSKDGDLSAQLALGLAAGKAENVLNFEYKGIPTSSLAETIKADGQPLLNGGFVDLKISGDLNAVDSDLVATASFKDVFLRIAGSESSIDGMEMPIAIRGPIDSPQIKVDSDFLEEALKSAGRKKLLEKASEELGIDLGDDTSSEGLKKAAGELLGGFLNKKSEKEN